MPAGELRETSRKYIEHSIRRCPNAKVFDSATNVSVRNWDCKGDHEEWAAARKMNDKVKIRTIA